MAPKLEWLARAGYGARGAVFVILSYFTVVASLDAHTRPIDSKDALRSLLTEQLGVVLLLAIAAGLLCFAAWREAQCFLDADSCGSDLKGWLRRSVYGAAGLFYAGFASVAFSMVLGVHVRNTERAVHDWAAWLLSKPMGAWLGGSVGVCILVAGLCVGITGVRAEFKNRLSGLGRKPRWFVTLLGFVGYLTRAFVFSIIGLFIIFAALHADAREATGLAGALQAIKQQPHGALLLGFTAAGLFAFGAYGIAEAIFRRIDDSYSFDRSSWLRA